MATKFSIKIDQTDLENVRNMLQGMSQAEIDKSMRRIINNTVNNTRTEIWRSVLKDQLNLQQSFVYHGTAGTKQSITLRHAVAGDPEYSAGVITSGVNVPLVYYSNIRGKTLSTLPKRIKVTVKKSRGASILRHAFVPVLKSGHIGIFERVPGTGKIRQMFGPRVPDVLSNEDNMALVQKLVDDRLHANIANELKRLLGG